MYDIFTTKIGSHIWKMNRPDSDEDIFKVYAVSTVELLKGTANIRSKFKPSDERDVAIHEVGKVVEQVIKGNFNFLIGVMSPIVILTSDIHTELKDIVKRNVAKNCYHSIRGMCLHNYHKFIDNSVKGNEKKCNVILRSLLFGKTLLETGEFKFKPIVNGTIKDIDVAFQDIEEAYTNSKLPEIPNETTYRDWLYKVRSNILKNEGI